MNSVVDDVDRSVTVDDTLRLRWWRAAEPEGIPFAFTLGCLELERLG